MMRKAGRYSLDTLFVHALCARVVNGTFCNDGSGYFDIGSARSVFATVSNGMPLPAAYVFQYDLYGFDVRRLCKFLLEDSDLFYNTAAMEYVDISAVVKGERSNCVPVSCFLNTAKFLGVIERIGSETLKDRARLAADRISSAVVQVVTFHEDVTKKEFGDWLTTMSDCYLPDYNNWLHRKRETDAY